MFGTGHVGLDGAYFGDIAFLSNPTSYNQLPRQVVTPYKPSEDLEQTLLLPPTPTSPNSTQTASGYFSEATNLSIDGAHGPSKDNLSFDFRHPNKVQLDSNCETKPNIFNESNPFAHADNSFHSNDHQLLTHQTQPFTITENFVNLADKSVPNEADKKLWGEQDSHEYHEISDDEAHGDKVFDFGPSLLDEMDFMFRSMTAGSEPHAPLSPDFENVNKRNEITELHSKLSRKNSAPNNTHSGGYKSKKKATTVKPISVKDEKILNQAIEIANEISSRSMTDLVDQNAHTHSPKRKFSFRFGNMSHSAYDKDIGSQISGNHTMNHTSSAAYLSKERRNFSEEVKNVPDLQVRIFYVVKPLYM